MFTLRPRSLAELACDRHNRALSLVQRHPSFSVAPPSPSPSRLSIHPPSNMTERRKPRSNVISLSKRGGSHVCSFAFLPKGTVKLASAAYPAAVSISLVVVATPRRRHSACIVCWSPLTDPREAHSTRARRSRRPAVSDVLIPGPKLSLTQSWLFLPDSLSLRLSHPPTHTDELFECVTWWSQRKQPPPSMARRHSKLFSISDQLGSDD